MQDFDPATARALNDKLMVDPDLVNQSYNNAALYVVNDHSLPPINRSPEAIRGAQEEAIRLLGGSSGYKDLPEPGKGKPLAPEAKLTSGALATALGYGTCAASLEYSYIWAARLPENLPIYPGGNAKEAAGTDKGKCALRVVTFVTPVGLEDVIRFYFSQMLGTGFEPRVTRVEGDWRIEGTKGKGRVAVLGRRLPSELTEIDLVVNAR